jgi:DNA-binding MarR family transcriptional regulator
VEGQDLSSDARNKHTEFLGQLTFELRQFNGFGASFFRVAAAHAGMSVTDIQVIDLLDLLGPSSAGQLAELTGLTTGAITRILDRLEKTELVHRERDSFDGRKVIVRLASDIENTHKIRSILSSVGTVWHEVASRYDEGQIAFLLEFLTSCNTQTRQKLVQLQQEVSPDEGEVFSAPFENQRSGQLIVSCGISRLSVHADDSMTRLYQARFEGPIPKVAAKEAEVAIRYPRRLLGLGEKNGRAEIALSSTIPWRIVIHGGAAEVVVGGLNLAGLEIMGGFHTIRLDLPNPSGVVPIRISGGASEIVMRRPVGVPVRMKLKGWISQLTFDEQILTGGGNNLLLRSAGLDPATPNYDLEIKSYANSVVVSTG